MRSKCYWKSYHASKANEKRQVFKQCRRVARKLGPPWQVAKRGRPPEHQPEEYGAVAIYRKHFSMVLRSTEGDTQLLLSKRMDHSTIWWGLQRIPPGYLERGIEILFELIAGIFPLDLFISDSTGITTDRYVKSKRTKLRSEGKPPPKGRGNGRRGHGEDRELETLKLHVLMGYCIEAGLLPIRSAVVTKSHAHDSPQLKRLLRRVGGNGEPLLLDRGYDSEDNYKLGKKHGFDPVIKLRKWKPKGFVRIEMAENFGAKRETYRLRGLVEGIFGGSEVKYGNRTRCRLSRSRKVDCLLMIVSHNLRTYMRALALKELKIFVLLWIY